MADWARWRLKIYSRPLDLRRLNVPATFPGMQTTARGLRSKAGRTGRTREWGEGGSGGRKSVTNNRDLTPNYREIMVTQVVVKRRLLRRRTRARALVHSTVLICTLRPCSRDQAHCSALAAFFRYAIGDNCRARLGLFMPAAGSARRSVSG